MESGMLCQPIELPQYRNFFGAHAAQNFPRPFRPCDSITTYKYKVRVSAQARFIASSVVLGNSQADQGCAIPGRIGRAVALPQCAQVVA